MKSIRAALARVAGFFAGKRSNADLGAELQSHQEMETAELVRRGMEPDAARREALLRSGVLSQAAEAVRDQRGLPWLDGLMADIRYALRGLRHSPLFTITVVLTLALGIGANTAIYGVVSAVLLRPLPFPESDRLVRVYDDLAGGGAKDVGMSVPEWTDLRRAGIFERLAVVFPVSAALGGGDRIERIELLVTSPDYFELLGTRAALGRSYGAHDDTPGFGAGVVISDGLWKRQFGSDPAVIGRTVRLDEDPYTIIGVMPPGFRHPGNTVNGDVEIWASCGFLADPFPNTPIRGARVLPGALARLAPGLSATQAQAKLDAFAATQQRNFPADFPAAQRWALRLESAQESITGKVRPTLVILLAAVGFVLLLVCVNLAGVMMARSSARGAEFALRQALGATPGRLARQVLTESSLLALIGGVVALVVLGLARAPLLSLMPADIPRTTEIGADWRLVLVALAGSVVTGLLVGLIPAIQTSRFEPHEQLKEGGRSGTASVRQNRARAVLVVAQVALSVVLLAAAGLQMRSFAAVLNQNPGIEPEGLVMAQVWVPRPNNPANNPYIKAEARSTLVQGLLDHLGRLPDVQAAALGSSIDVPFLNSVTRAFPFSLPDQPAGQDSNRAAQFGTVSPTFFQTLGTPLRQGRVFSDHDDLGAPLVAVVNEAFVRTFSPSQDVIGHRLRVGAATDFQVVGVVADVHTGGLDQPAPPHIYVPILQRPSVAIAIFVRTRQSARQMQATITSLVHTVDPELPVFGVKTMDELMSQSMARRRFSLYLIAAFGVAALCLAVLGIYGVMSLVVTQRRPEFAVRLALGARPSDILKLAFGPGIRLAGIGTAIGLVLAIAVASSMAALVYGVSARDPLTFITVAVILPAGAAVACLVPATRAMRVPLIEVLKR